MDCTRIGLGSLVVAIFMALAAPALATIGVGEAAPDFILYDLEEMPHQLSSFATHPVLILFLGCQDDASRTVASQIQSDIYDSYASRGLFIRGIECMRGNAAALRRFRTESGAQFPLLLNGEGVMASYDVPVNTIVLINGEGLVSYISLGPGIDAYEEGALRNAVDEVLREANDVKAMTWGLIRNLYK